MPFRICKSFEIESGHMLSKHPDKCRFPHGHTRKVEFVLEADSLDGNDMVCDFKVVKEIVSGFLESYDHSMCMNTADPEFPRMKEAYGERIIAFTETDPTTEVMAQTIFQYFTEQLAAYANRSEKKYAIRSSVRLVSVRLWETSSSWAEFSV